MTAWYKIKGNKLGWWGKYGGQGEMGENLFCDDDTWTTTSPFSTPSPPCTAAFLANGVRAQACGLSTCSGWGEGQCHGLFPLSFPRTLLTIGNLKTSWWIVKAPADPERFGKFPAAEPHYCIRAKLPVPISVLLPPAQVQRWGGGCLSWRNILLVTAS